MPLSCTGKPCHYQPIWPPGCVDPLGDNRLCTRSTGQGQHLVLRYQRLPPLVNFLCLRHWLLTICIATCLPRSQAPDQALCHCGQESQELPCTAHLHQCRAQSKDAHSYQVLLEPGLHCLITGLQESQGQLGGTPPLQPPTRGRKGSYRLPPGTRFV